MKKYLKFFVKLGISLGFIAWIIFKVDWSEVFSLLRSIEARYILIYFVLLILGIAISAYKWKKLAEFKNINLPFTDFFKFYLTGTFVNNFMPSFIGGDAYRAYQAGKPEKKYSEAASSVVMDRLTGLFGAMILTLFFSLLNFSTVITKDILTTLNLVVLAGIIFVLIFFIARNKKTVDLRNARVSKYVPEKMLKFIADLAQYRGASSVLSRALLLSFVFGLVGLAASNYVLFLAMGAKINLLDYLSVIFLISFVSSIPISINNIGIKEWAYMTFFAFFGVGSSIVITAAILSRFLQMLLSSLALPIYLKNK